jgi:hypothetical protein
MITCDSVLSINIREIPALGFLVLIYLRILKSSASFVAMFFDSNQFSSHDLIMPILNPIW